MICGKQRIAPSLQSSQRGCRHARLLLGGSRAAPRPLAGSAPATDRCHSSSNGSSRPSVRCSAEPEPDSGYTEPEPVSGFTPADYISFSTDEHKQCHHNAEVWVDAPIDVCYAKWSEWNRLLDFLDLVGQIGLDSNNPNMALFQCFYRFRKLPLMEIVFLLEREEEEMEEYRAIHFKSVHGMPIKGQVQLSEQLNAQTRVRLYFTHPVPNLLVQLQIGPFGVETDMQQILKENMAAYKQQAEAAAPADWEQQKPGVIAKVQKLVEDLKIVSLLEVEERERKEQEAQQQQEQQEQEQEQAQEKEGASDQPQQQQQVQQPQPPSQPAASVDPQQQTGAAGKRPRGRSTASKASAAEAVSAAAQAAAAEAAGGQEAAPRAGRKMTRGRSASKTAAATDDNSRGSAAAKRRSRTASSAAEAADSSNGNGTGPAPGGSSVPASSKGSGRRSTTTRRTSKRPSTAAQE